MKHFYVLLFITTIFSCRKPPSELCQDPIIETCVGAHEQYSTLDYTYLWSELQSEAFVIGGPYFTQLDDFGYRQPVFNPNNANEIAYIKMYNDNPSTYIEREIWKFNFCTGESQMIANNFYYNLDWGSNGWLLYTGTDHKIFKVKASGDSLTVISDSGGYNRAGKWNPSGTIYWNNRDNDGTIFEDVLGEIIHINNSTLPFGPFDWLDDSTLIGWRYDNLYSMSIPSESLMLLNNNWTCSTCPKILNEDDMTCYVSKTNSPKAFLKYSLDGSNEVDTLRNLISSYNYGSGDYLNQKLIIRLVRMHWADSTADNRYIRNNLLIMDPDGTNERLIEIPE